jgi:hypothetical protein
VRLVGFCSILWMMMHGTMNVNILQIYLMMVGAYGRTPNYATKQIFYY